MMLYRISCWCLIIICTMVLLVGMINFLNFLGGFNAT